MMLLSFNVPAQWITLDSGTLIELSAVLVDDADTYWVGGEFGTLMKTTDGGDTWNTQVLAQAGDIGSIVRINDTTLLFAADGGQIGRSIDNGATWTIIATEAPNVLYDITSFGEHVWASGRDGGLVYSADQGATWTLQNSGSTSRLHGIHAIDAMNVVCVGRDGTYLQTSNGGATWTSAILADEEDLIDVIFLADAQQTGLIAGPPSEILRTPDLGGTWNSVPYNSLLEVGAFASEDPSIVYAVGADALILRSFDQGASWDTMTTTAIAELGGVAVKDGIAIAAGSNGTILKLDPDTPQAIHEQPFPGDLNVFPNPSKGPVNIELSGVEITEGSFTLEVLLVDGRLVDRTIWPVGKRKAFIEELDPGTYIVRLISAAGSSIQRNLIVTGR